MNFERLVVLKALDGNEQHREEAFRKIAERGIDASFFFTDKKYWLFPIEHKKKYGKYPARGTFEKSLKITEVIDVKEPLDYYLDELGKHKRFRLVVEAMDKTDKLFEADDIDGAISNLKIALKKVDATMKSKDMIYTKSVDARVQQYEYRIANPGVDGIPSGLPQLDKATYGWHKGELILLSAFLGSYKTWMLLYMAKAAMMAGYKPLICTVEMGQAQVARRLDSIMTATEFEKIRAGKFRDQQDIDNFKVRMDALKAGPECIIMGGNSFGELALQSKIEEHAPDIVLVDGMYLMTDDAGKKAQWEALISISRGLKLIAENYELPVLATTQAWRPSSKQGSEGKESVDDIAFSGGIAQNVDVAMSIGRIYDAVIEAFTNKVWVKLTKLREGEPVKFKAELDFSDMKLRESIGVTDDRTKDPDEVKFKSSRGENDSIVEGAAQDPVNEDDIPF